MVLLGPVVAGNQAEAEPGKGEAACQPAGELLAGPRDPGPA